MTQDNPEIVLISYGTEHPAPPAAMLAIDVSNLLAPHPATDKRVTGLDPKVAREVLDGVGAKRLIEHLLDLAETMLALYGPRGVVTMAVGSAEGRIRSIAVVDELARQLRDGQWRVESRHRPHRPSPAAEAAAARRPHGAVRAGV